MPRTCRRDCLWIQNYFLIRYITLKTFWNDLKQYNITKINVEGEIITTVGRAFIWEGKKSPCKAWPCSILNVVSGLYFSKETSKSQACYKACGDLIVQCGDSLCHIFCLRIHYAGLTAPPQLMSTFPGNCKVSPCTKAHGKCFMDLAANVKATLCGSSTVYPAI